MWEEEFGPERKLEPGRASELVKGPEHGAESALETASLAVEKVVTWSAVATDSSGARESGPLWKALLVCWEGHHVPLGLVHSVVFLVAQVEAQAWTPGTALASGARSSC